MPIIVYDKMSGRVIRKQVNNFPKPVVIGVYSVVIVDSLEGIGDIYKPKQQVFKEGVEGVKPDNFVYTGEKYLIPGHTSNIEIEAQLTDKKCIDFNEILSVSITGADSKSQIYQMKFNNGSCIIRVVPDLQSVSVNVSVKYQDKNFIIQIPVKLYVGEEVILSTK